MVLNNKEKESNIALNIDQMRHLKSLGMNCDDASMVYHPLTQHSDIFNLQVTNIELRKKLRSNPKTMAIIGEDNFNLMYGRDVPAYTADDILRKLPQEIIVNGIKHRIFFTIRSRGKKPEYQASYNFADEDGKMKSSLMDVWKSDSFLTLLYGILIWCITNKHLPL